MKLITRKFSPGDTVACYSGEVVEFGEVISLQKDIAKVSIDRNVYGENNERGTTTVFVEFMLRGKDGLYVAPQCFDEHVPSKMIVNMDDMGAVNRWRYFPSLTEKIKRKFKTMGRLKRDDSPEGREDAAKYFRI